MGFEFGYSVAEHRALVMWEAQFGDFMNGAQVIIDQFLPGSETKWRQPRASCCCCPTATKARGPSIRARASSASSPCAPRTTCASCYPSTPASYFHLLRWQGRDHVEKPLVVFTPKSLLRHPRCVSSLAGAGRRPIPARDRRRGRRIPGRVRRVVLVSGKLYYDLLQGREEQQADQVAIVRSSSSTRSPRPSSRVVLARYAPRRELVWAQEEPRNMGAWRFVRERFLDGEVPDPARRLPRYIGRSSPGRSCPGLAQGPRGRAGGHRRGSLELTSPSASGGTSRGLGRGGTLRLLATSRAIVRRQAQGAKASSP